MTDTLFPMQPRGIRELVRRTDPDTSREAAASLSAEQLAGSKQAVADALLSRGPMTDRELVAYLTPDPERPAFSPSRIRTARHDLSSAGLVVFAGIRAVPTHGGVRRHQLWRLA